jgi:flagellar assembly factor FliW
MLVKTAHLGEIAVKEENIITFNSGLPAFEGFPRFALLDIAQNDNFKWMQCIDDPETAFLLVDPFTVKPDYSVSLNDDLVKSMEISNPEDALVYTIVNVPASGLKDATTNLIGPLIINWRQKNARQIILDAEVNVLKYPLFAEGR